MDRRVKQVSDHIRTLLGFGRVRIGVIISCDCNNLDVGHGTGGRLSGTILKIDFCLKASVSKLDVQLENWCKEHGVDVFLDCQFGSAYTTIMNM